MKSLWGIRVLSGEEYGPSLQEWEILERTIMETIMIYHR